MQSSIAVVDRVAGFHLPERANRIFWRFNEYTINPIPGYIQAWRAEATTEKRYLAHVGGIKDNARNALAGAYYHREAIARMETTIRSQLAALGCEKVIQPQSSIGLGNTLKLDFEYHGFVISVRRCLDLLTQGLIIFFGQQQDSFRKLPQTISGLKPEAIVRRLLDAHAKHVGNFGYVLSDGRGTSTRDRLIHKDHVGAGTINLSSEGLIFAGGGEGLAVLGNTATALTDAVDSRLDALQSCVDDMIDAFMDGAREADV